MDSEEKTDKAVLTKSTETAHEETKNTEDDSASATKLRNLLRQGRIDSSQYLGALATLVATGIISKGEFSRLKASL